MHLGFGIWAPCMGPWDPWPKKFGFGPLAWALWDPWPIWARAGPGPIKTVEFSRPRDPSKKHRAEILCKTAAVPRKIERRRPISRPKEFLNFRRNLSKNNKNLAKCCKHLANIWRILTNIWRHLANIWRTIGEHLAKFGEHLAKNNEHLANIWRTMANIWRNIAKYAVPEQEISDFLSTFFDRFQTMRRRTFKFGQAPDQIAHRKK